MAATKDAAEYGTQLIEAARTNSAAVFDFVIELLETRSPSKWWSYRQPICASSSMHRLNIRGARWARPKGRA